jgi:chromate transporter
MKPVDSPSPPQSVTLREAFWVWVKVALLSFGGPAGQIAVMHRILVEQKRWISDRRFLHALNYCMLLPGPEAQQLATYIGWLLHRTLGGLIAGGLFVLPGFVSILALSILYAQYQELTFVQAIFYGLKPAVMAVVVEAVVRIGRRVLRNAVLVGVSAAALVAIFLFEVPFPVIIVSAAAIGLAGGRIWPEQFTAASPHKPSADGADAQPVIADVQATQRRASAASTARVAAVWLAIWLLPLGAIAWLLGREHVLVTQGVFFSTAAVVTFGGAYAVLAYVAQQAVETYGWLAPGEMLDGLGMAETTPGPLIQVVQFVGFMGAYRHPGTLDPLVAGLLGSIIVTWVTFAPCFLWIFVGAPYIERLRGSKLLSTALASVTAAVVGVILNLAVWFSLHVLFAKVEERHVGAVRLLVPDWRTIDPVALLIAAGALLAMLRFKRGMIETLVVAGVVGAAAYLLR